MTPSEPLVLVNGLPDGALSPLDRGMAYGDGVFRTLRLEAGEPVWWVDHLARLDEDCARLGLSPPARVDWEQDLAWIAARQSDAVIRLTVTRGVGPRGYRAPDLAVPTRLTQASPLPAFPDPLADTGAVLRVCDLRLGEQPRLAGVKHLNRLENVLARMEWSTPEIDEGILLDGAGRVVSGVMGNLFIRREGHWYTPNLSRSGVAGVTRARLMRRLPVEETDFGLDELLAADAVLLTNSLIRLRWVARLGERTWSRPADFDEWLERLC